MPTAADVEHAVLTTPTGAALLAEVSAVATPGPAALESWRKQSSPEWVAAALRLVEARRKAAPKFARADEMWLDLVGAEQATAEQVARHKAARFAGESPVVDLCCGVGGDAVALAETAAGVLAVDRDMGMCRRASWNTARAGVSDRFQAVRCAAEIFPIPTGALVHIDPDRRAGRARRARNVGDYTPGPTFLDRLMTTTPGGAIKLSPASDFEACFGRPGIEIEVVSLNSECKEATVWFGRLADCRRRATCLPSGASWTDRDGPAEIRPHILPVGTWIFEPDPALTRSGLLDAFATSHGLGRLAAGVDLLTGPKGLESPFLTAFEVEEILPLDRKRLRRLLRDQDIGAPEIKTRGLDLRPEDLRRELRGEGGRPATLFLVGGRGRSSRAILAHRARS